MANIERTVDAVNLTRGPSSGLLGYLWERGQVIVLPVTTAALFLLAWQFAVTTFGVSDVILPPPSEIIEEFTAHSHIILRHLVPTAMEAVLAFAIAVPFGVLLATLLTMFKFARQALYPNVILFQIIPKIAVAPLFIIWLGIGTPSRVTFAVFISFFPVLISTATGLRSVGPELIKLCQSVGASKWKILWKVGFPTALPFIFNGMKITITMSVIGIVVGEFIAAQRGLGFLILFASSHQQTDLCLAAVGLLCVLGLTLYGLVACAELLMQRIFGDGTPIRETLT
jgi:NitT/TauT family transport system permease protein